MSAGFGRHEKSARDEALRKHKPARTTWKVWCLGEKNETILFNCGLLALVHCCLLSPPSFLCAVSVGTAQLLAFDAQQT